MSSSKIRTRSTTSSKTGSDTNADSRERLVQAASDLLSERGLGELRVLDVAARAQANVALINYHFGGRDGLIDEVIQRAAMRIGTEREKRLQRLLADSPNAKPTVDALMRAWLSPLTKEIATPGGLATFKTMIHLTFAADVTDERKQAQVKQATVVTAKYLDVLERILPELDRATLAWRMFAAIGSCYLVLGRAEPARWKTLTGAATSKKANTENVINALATFIAAGISAPVQ